MQPGHQLLAVCCRPAGSRTSSLLLCTRVAIPCKGRYGQTLAAHPSFTQSTSQQRCACRTHASVAPDLHLDRVPVKTLTSNTAAGLQNLCHVLEVCLLQGPGPSSCRCHCPFFLGSTDDTPVMGGRKACLICWRISTWCECAEQAGVKICPQAA